MCLNNQYQAPPNYPLRDPKYHLMETIRPFIDEVHGGVVVQVPTYAVGRFDLLINLELLHPPRQARAGNFRYKPRSKLLIGLYIGIIYGALTKGLLGYK